MVAFLRLPVSQAGRLRLVLSMIAMVSMYDIFSMH